MHTDEAVHAAKFGLLLEEGSYIYDPADFHGPTLYYFTLPGAWIKGIRNLRDLDARTVRMVPVFFGVALVLLTACCGGMSREAALWAALLAAVSPAMAYYSRYYIQETLLVCFTFISILAFRQWFRCGEGSRSVWWMIGTGICLGLMHATKETALLAWIAMAGGILLTLTWEVIVAGKPEVPKVRPIQGALIVLVALLTSAMLVSQGFRNPQAIAESWTTYGQYLHRAKGAGIHNHPWQFYFHRLLFYKNAPGPVWSEALAVGLGMVGTVGALRPRAVRDGRRRFSLFVAFYTMILAAIYTFIPYKTPWCMLGFFHGLILLAGIGIVTLLNGLRWPVVRATAYVVLLAAVFQLGQQAYRTCFVYCADTRNPYVYGQTSSDVVRIEERVRGLTMLHPDGDDMLVKVYAQEYWPLPWYLREFKRVGYWQTLPDASQSLDAPVIIVAPEFQEMLDQRLQDQYIREYRGLRPEVPVLVYVESELWKTFLASQEGKS